MLITRIIRPSSPPVPDETECWAIFAQFLGYALLSTGCAPGDPSWLATMGRPDGSTTTIAMPEADLRHLLRQIGNA